MKSIYFASLVGFMLFCLGSQVAVAKGDVTAVEKLLEKEIRAVLSLSFEVTNQSERGMEEERLELPIRLLSVLVSANAVAGNDSLTYTVEEQNNPGNSDSDKIDVTVIPTSGIKIELLEALATVIADQSYEEARFSLRNTGNVPVFLKKLSVRDPLEYVKAIEPPEMSLDAHASADIPLKSQTSEAITKSKLHRIELQTRTADGEVWARGNAVVDVVASSLGKERNYYTLPSRLTLHYVEPSGGSSGGEAFQTELSAKGTLDKEKQHHVDLFFRGPNTHDHSNLGTWEKYRASYWNDNWAFHAGDRTYKLSKLAERNYYGRGIEIGVSPGNWLFKTFQTENRPDASQRKEKSGLSAEYEIISDISIGTSYIDKTDDEETAKIASLYGLIDKKPLQVEWEAARDKDASAYYLKIKGRKNKFLYQLRGIHADAAFEGYEQDKKDYRAEMFFNASKHWRLKCLARYLRNNLADDASRSINEKIEYRLATEYEVGRKSEANIFVEFRQLERKDLRLIPDEDNSLESVRLRYRHRFNKFSLHTQSEWGELVDNLTGKELGRENHRLAVSYQPTKKQNYGLNLEFGEPLKNVIGNPIKKIGFNASVQMTKQTSLTASLSHSESGGRNNDNFQLGLRHEFGSP